MRWFGHVERMDDEKAPVKAKSLFLKVQKKGRPNKRWKEVVQKDMLVRGLKRTDAQDCSLWRFGWMNRPGFRMMKIFASTPGTNG